LGGQIAYEIRNPTPGWGYEFELNDHEYMLIQDRPEDGSCGYYYELSRDGEPIQCYEIMPSRKIAPAIIWLVALCVVMFFPLAAGELSESYMGVSVLDWGIGTQFAVVIAAVLSAIGLIGMIIGIFGRPIIKNHMGASDAEI